ncbi:VOC family protein [Haloferax chudinovii]|uniref:VOC family protein n=1 Tax=Haloferax chudinovii TaxID=1109010 RepID=A0ABD5X9R2_9EURY
MKHHNTPIHVEHVGIAVESVRDAEPVLVALGCQKLLDDTVDDQFRWAYYRLGDGSRIELIEPTGADSFLTQYLDANGPGLHHVTLEVADIEAVVEAMEANGFSVVDYERRDEWAEAFVSPRNPTGTLFQLMEYHDAYERRRPHPPEELFVSGFRLSAPDDD